MARFHDPVVMEISLNQLPHPGQAESHVSVTDSVLPSVLPTDQPEDLVAAEHLAASSSSLSSRIPNELLYKNRLQEYAQKSSIPLPIYQTYNEGVQHAPQFRSTVSVDGAYYTSENTFNNRKAAEQDAARLALEHISKKIKDEGCPLVQEDTVFCKSILNEYAVKMKLEQPIYNTIQPEGLLPTFISSLVFNGVSYVGEIGKNKKEAEQLAARAVILSLMGTSDSGTVLSEIIKSKTKLYAALNKVKESQHPQNGIAPFGVNAGNTFETSFNKDKEVGNAITIYNLSRSAIPEGTLQVYPPHHEFRLPKPDPSHEMINPPIAFVPSVMDQPLGVRSPIKRKNSRNKKKSNKKGRTNAEMSVAVMPINQPSPCSVAQ